MTKLNINHLSISWGVSRGRDTYGYNICRLDDRNNGKRYRTCGGGYDMIGTVFGHWLQDVYQDRLFELVKNLMRYPEAFSQYGSLPGWIQFKDLYGMIYKTNSGKVSLDGACGIGSMRRIAEAIGLDVQWEGNRKGHTIGFFVSEEVTQ